MIHSRKWLIFCSILFFFPAASGAATVYELQDFIFNKEIIISDFRAAPHEVQLRPLSCHAAKKYERFQLVEFCSPSQTLYHMTVKQNLRFP